MRTSRWKKWLSRQLRPAVFGRFGFAQSVADETKRKVKTRRHLCIGTRQTDERCGKVKIEVVITRTDV